MQNNQPDHKTGNAQPGQGQDGKRQHEQNIGNKIDPANDKRSGQSGQKQAPGSQPLSTGKPQQNAGHKQHK